MKKFLFALLCVMLTAGFAFAVDVDLKGMYYVRGSYIDNDSGLSSSSTANYMYYDHELDLTARLLVTDKTRVIVNFEIRDENWNASNTDGSKVVAGKDLDDNIEFKRVFFSHTFDAYGTVLDAGLMTGGVWATSFGETGQGKYRVKVTQPTEFGPIIALVEKGAELGSTNPNLKDSEKDDTDSYAIAMVTKLGPVNVKPLIQYVNGSSAILDQGNDGQTVLAFALGVDGTFGDFGFESEFVVKDYDNGDFDVPPAPVGTDEDYTLWGLYGNGWWNIGAGKVGLLAAYGNWDDDAGKGFGFGEDFTPTLFSGADWASFGGNQGFTEYVATSLVQLYGSLALSEELSIWGNGTYMAANADENADGTDNFWQDATGYELNLGLNWKLTDQVTYSIAAGFGEWDLDAGEDANDGDPDSFARAYHRFKIDF